MGDCCGPACSWFSAPSTPLSPWGVAMVTACGTIVHVIPVLIRTFRLANMDTHRGWVVRRVSALKHNKRISTYDKHKHDGSRHANQQVRNHCHMVKDHLHKKHISHSLWCLSGWASLSDCWEVAVALDSSRSSRCSSSLWADEELEDPAKSERSSDILAGDPSGGPAVCSCGDAVSEADTVLDWPDLFLNRIGEL